MSGEIETYNREKPVIHSVWFVDLLSSENGVQKSDKLP